MSDLFGNPDGKRTERTEWGQRYTRDNVFGRKGEVARTPGETAARLHSGAFYPGGPKSFVPVRRTVVTYTSDWEEA